MFSQRYPEMFDGIVAGNPGMDLPKAAVAEAWDSQAFAGAARSLTPFGNPDLATSFTPAELSAVGDAITQACDAQTVWSTAWCSIPARVASTRRRWGRPARARCRPRRSARSRRSSAARRTRRAERSTPAGSGIRASRPRAGASGRSGPLFPFPGNTSLNTTLGGGRPAVRLHDAAELAHRRHRARRGHGGHQRRADPEPSGCRRRLHALAAELQHGHRRAEDLRPRGAFTESAMDFMGTSSTDYRRFRRTDRKLIVYSGQADPVFSSKYHIAWYRQPRRRQRRPASRRSSSRACSSCRHEPLRRRLRHVAVRRVRARSSSGSRSGKAPDEPDRHRAHRHALAWPHPPAVCVAHAGPLRRTRQHRGRGQLRLCGAAQRPRSRPSRRRLNRRASCATADSTQIGIQVGGAELPR